MPTHEALDNMSRKIAGVPWDGLKFPEHRVQIMTLALADEANSIQDAIEGHLSEMHKLQSKQVELLDNMDNWIATIGEWFKKSKLWDAEIYANVREC